MDENFHPNIQGYVLIYFNLMGFKHTYFSIKKSTHLDFGLFK